MQTETVLITGCTGLIGTRLVEYYLSVGSKVIGVSRSKDNISQLKKLPHANLFTECVLDLEKKNAAKDLVKFTITHSMSPTSIVFAARNTAYLIRKAGNMVPREQWLGEYLLDVVVPYEVTHELSGVKGSRLQSVVLISSMYGIVAQNPKLYKGNDTALVPQYGAAKSAQLQVAKDMAVEMAGKGIRVNAVCLGGVEGKVDTAFKELFATHLPKKRMMFPTEVVGPVAFLTSSKSNYVTGATFNVDGGWTAW